MFRSGFIGSRVARFHKDEEGSLIIFSMFIFLTMIIFGGIAVDLMLYENRRTHVQNSTDRAVLAAANIKQTVPAKEVVKDYLAKVGIEVDDDDIDVQQVGTMPVVTGRQVSVKVDAQSPTILMNMIGIDWLPYGAVSEAEQSVNDVEVSLVLDISGSMGSPASKLTNMQNAATDFVEGVLEGAEDNRVSVSLVPYSTQVSAGPELIQRITTEHNHDYSHCVNFEPEDFETTAIHRWRPKVDDDGELVEDSDGNPVYEPIPLSQTASFDPWAGWNSRSRYYSVCREESYVDILPWSNSITDLTTRIDAFTASGNTSIDVAMKWATALLDPSMNDALNSLKDDTTDGIDIDPEFAVRPRDHTYPDVLKFIVLMTDGINTTQYTIDEALKEGMSNMFWDYNDHWMEVDNGSGGYDYWNLDDRCWHYEDRNTCNETRVPDEDTRLTNLEMWNDMRMRWRAYNGFYRRTWSAPDYYNALGGYNAPYDQGPRIPIHARTVDEPRHDTANELDPYFDANVDTKDKRLDAICTKAKAAGVVVFTIGFEVTDASAEIMEKCASSDQHFYRVNGEDIQYAFASIKNQINQLKLTQ